MATAELVLARVLKRVRWNPKPRRPRLACPRCLGVPLSPVTGACGHAWCGECARAGARCACGAPAPTGSAGDVLVARLVAVAMEPLRRAAAERRRAQLMLERGDAAGAAESCARGLLEDPRNVYLRLTLARIHVQAREYALARGQLHAVRRLAPRLDEAHYLLGMVQMERKKHGSALRSFFKANILGKDLSEIRSQMLELIERSLLKVKRPYRLARKIRLKLKTSLKLYEEHHSEPVQPPIAVDATELECPVCKHVFEEPVTTPCGHTFCWPCLERCLENNLHCPLCHGSIDQMRDHPPCESAFVAAIAEQFSPSMRCRDPENAGLLPLILCTTGFPSVSCPLLIKEGGPYRLMVRRCLQSEKRQFGMISYQLAVGENPTPHYADYGIVLEIRDCVTLPDGSLILSTVGKTRFRVVSRGQVDGYEVADVDFVKDREDCEDSDEGRRLYASVRTKAVQWVNNMTGEAREELESSFGQMPPDGVEWELDGPAWMWWLLAALPLTVQLKRMLLSTTELLLRLRAIDKALDLRSWSLQKDRHAGVPHLVLPDKEEIERPVLPNIETWVLGPGGLEGLDDMNIAI